MSNFEAIKFSDTPTSEVYSDPADIVVAENSAGSFYQTTAAGLVSGVSIPRRQYIIDGDGNHANRGITSITAAGYLTDVWKGITVNGTVSYSGGEYTITPTANLSTDFGQEQYGTYFDGKAMSIIFQAKYTGTNVATFRAAGGLSSTVFGSNIASSLTTSYQWFRQDIVFPSPGASTSGLYFNAVSGGTAGTVNIKNMRMVETQDLPTGVIPDWVKEDEDYLETKQKAMLYFNSINTGSSNRRAIPCYVNSATQAQFYLPVGSMIPPGSENTAPVITFTDVNIIDGGGTGRTISASLLTRDSTSQCVFVIVTISGATTGDGWVNFVSSAGTIKIDNAP